MKNSGKVFEECFRKSVPDFCLVHRLKDSAQSFNQSNLTKFAWDNPCDFFIFDSINCILYCLELKSTKYKSMSFEKIEDKNSQKKMIHAHQIKSLMKFGGYDNVFSGFVFNFRDEKNQMERTYIQNINDFMRMCRNINKQSFNEMDLILYKAKKINGTKKRVNYKWNLEECFNVIGGI